MRRAHPSAGERHFFSSFFLSFSLSFFRFSFSSFCVSLSHSYSLIKKDLSKSISKFKSNIKKADSNKINSVVFEWGLTYAMAQCRMTPKSESIF